MIPVTSTELEIDFEITEQPTRTYELHTEKSVINGYTDSLDAMKQAVYKILNTERFSYEIYSWNYGIELRDLIGEQKGYVYPEVKRRIIEALTQDERVESVDAFSFSSDKNNVLVTFIVHTTVGDIEAEKVVEI